MDQNIAAQHVKSEMMCQLGGRTLQHGSPESKVQVSKAWCCCVSRSFADKSFTQSCLDKNFPPPTDTDLVQEAKSRLMAQAGQIHPGSFEAKFQVIFQ